MFTLRLDGASLAVATLTEEDAATLVTHFEPDTPEGADYVVSAAAVERLAVVGAPEGLVAALRAALDGRPKVKVMLEREAISEPSRGGEVEVAGRLLECLVCRSGRFEHRKAQLHSRLSTMLGLEWLGPTTDCFVCVECGYIHWFQRTA